MLIIFDLDDTLIDTSGSVTPVLIDRALKKIIEEGFDVPFERAREMLQRMNQTTSSARIALEEFLELHDAMDYFDSAEAAVYRDEPLNFPVFPVDGATEVLKVLTRQSHQLAIVSIGKEERQLEKMSAAGIDRDLFSKIFMIEETDKFATYERVARELKIPANDVIVCGDRIRRDLKPAKKLGFTTVQLLWGRGLNDYGSKRDADYCIMKLSELCGLVAGRAK